MTNYEKRLINFLRANPNIRMTAKQIASVWKRSHHDVLTAQMSLSRQGKIKVGLTGLYIPKQCEGAGIA